MKQMRITHQFLDFIPETLEEGVLYISQRFGTATHKCCCGCGKEVVTPLTPTDWSLRTEGGTVTLHPSIGNWSYPCQSHYFIRRNQVVWAGAMTKQQIARGRAAERATKDAYFRKANQAQLTTHHAPQQQPSQSSEAGLLGALWATVKCWFSP